MVFTSQQWILWVGCLGLCSCVSLGRNPDKTQIVFTRRWARSTLDQPFLESRRVHRMTPILTPDTVYQGNAIDGIMAFRRQSGQLVWKRPIHGGVEGGAQLVDGTLYFGASDGFFYAVNANDGTVNWTFPIHFEGLGEPLVTNGVVYFLAGNNVAYALEARSGKQIWLYNRRDTSSLSIRGGSRPALAGDFVVIGFSDGYVVALDKAHGQIQWETNINNNKRFRDVDSSPVVDHDKLYLTSFDGGIYCLNAVNGQIVWNHDDGGYSAPIIEGDALIYSTSNSKVLAVNKMTGNVIWSQLLSGQLATQPVFMRGAIFFGEFGGDLVAMNSKTGQKITEFSPGRGVTSSPAIDSSKNEIYFISADANLFALKLRRTTRHIGRFDSVFQ